MVEGPTLVASALDAGLEVQEVFAVAGTDPALLGRFARIGVPVHPVTADTLARAVDTVTPQGVAAIATRCEVSVEQAVAAAAEGPLAVVLVDVNDPGNAGTIVRSAEAAGATAVLFCGSTVDPCNPKCVRASAGALFHVPVASGGDAVAVLERLGEAGVQTAATVVRGGTPYDETDLTGPLAIVLGSEAHGLPPALSDHVGLHVTIPLAGRAESLNVAMAAAILSFEAMRQRRAAAR